ncbi:siroheme synthase CysG [Ferrovibrio sp.]|uniref:siroheme synthase CysG n=1 Tax=Ferrovibrio sp. TaxID=1917215 RepID=UPI001B3D43C1|nr:siroheme synthase CysG [Ferrovibrio sp.]MBP7064480.1 uroporphyrinogen-III C-methyltransferase [Ferrovibrio sp.]
MPIESSRKPVEASPARIAPLAVLPLFLNLQNRRAVVIGNSEAAAWKAELLAAAGADLLQLQNWQAGDLAGAALVVADIDGLDECAMLQAACHAARALCCIIDKPAFCDVQFGAIVNRSPVVIGIATAGAAPVLAQAVRRRIETALPLALGAWAAAAKALRGRIAALLPDKAARRSFWRRFAEQAFTRPLPDTAEILALAEPAETTAGEVTLVGAGPGDAELLTLKAMRALQAADVILFDDLVSDDVLELARREAKRLLVGKRGRRASCKQDDINALMIKLARQGKNVVRLKSGDPMIFGRAGEEIEALRAAGIPVRVVPGVTAALAAAAELGVSLTHRQAAHSVRFVTGHSRQGALPADIDWRGLADPETTLMFYMGGRTAPEIARRLIAEGLSPDMPVVALASVSRPGRQVWHGSLGGLLAGLALSDAEGPVLLGIGAVFSSALRLAQTSAAPDHPTGLAAALPATPRSAA